MQYKAIISIIVCIMLTGCAAQEEPVSQREPKTLLTEDDYTDLKIKPRKKEPVEMIDYKKGTQTQSFDITKKVSPQEAIQNKILSVATYWFG